MNALVFVRRRASPKAVSVLGSAEGESVDGTAGLLRYDQSDLLALCSFCLFCLFFLVFIYFGASLQHSGRRHLNLALPPMYDAVKTPNDEDFDVPALHFGGGR